MQLLLATAILSSIPLTSFGSPGVSYQVTDLGTLAGYQNSYAKGVNSSGQVVGNSGPITGDQHAFIFQDGSMHDLNSLIPADSGWDLVDATAINDAGQVAGYGRVGLEYHAFLYAGGAVQDLGVLPQNNFPAMSRAYAINNKGDIAGVASVNGWFHAFLYTDSGMQDIGWLGGDMREAHGINSAGQVVGYSMTTNDTDAHAFLYANGTMNDLGTPSGGTWSDAYAINDMGDVVGSWRVTGPNVDRPFLYVDNVMHDIGDLGGGTGDARSINDNGQIVGESTLANGDSHAFLYDQGGMTDINSLIPTGSGWTLTQANAINDAGQIVGYGINPAGETDAFLLTPVVVPEPGTVLVLGVGGVVVWGRRRGGAGGLRM